MHFPMKKSSERVYIDLILHSSSKYAAWDPEIEVKVGDYGRITRGRRGLAFWRKPQGIFLSQGNIYEDGSASRHKIPEPKLLGGSATDGVTWISSDNAEQTEMPADMT
jgi:hypothetical protein